MIPEIKYYVFQNVIGYFINNKYNEHLNEKKRIGDLGITTYAVMCAGCPMLGRFLHTHILERPNRGSTR